MYVVTGTAAAYVVRVRFVVNCCCIECWVLEKRRNTSGCVCCGLRQTQTKSVRAQFLSLQAKIVPTIVTCFTVGKTCWVVYVN